MQIILKFVLLMSLITAIFNFPDVQSEVNSTINNNCVINGEYHNESSEEFLEQYNLFSNDDRPSRIIWTLKFLYNTAVCENVTSLTSNQLPSNDLNNLKSISFKNSNISLVPVGVLDVYQDLNELYFNNTNVKSMHPGAFTSLKNLIELHLQHNCITKITPGILNSLPNLNKLDLSYNNISEISEHAFLGLFKLAILDISFNRLSYIFPNIFYNLVSLRDVDLSHNNFIDFSIDYVPANLNYDISYNQLTTYNFSVFQSALRNVDLRSNKIENIAWFENASIESLDLSNNRLSYIDYVASNIIYLNFSANQFSSILDETLFNSSQVLRTLDFSSNVIASLSVDVFKELRNLRNLMMQNNLINEIPVGCFRNLNSLTELNLSANLLRDLDYGTFTGLSALTNLDLSNNKLNILYASSLHPLKQLQVLNIAHNFLNYIDSQDLLDISRNLRYVSLHDNSWSCEVLAKTIRTLEKGLVVVEQGPHRQVRNHHGITCEKYSENIDFHSSMNASTDEDSNSQPEMSVVLKNFGKYFNSEFLKSEFYKYFENLKTYNNAKNISKNYIDSIKLTDNVFETTKLYKFFTSEIPKTNPLNQLLQKITNVMQDLNNTKIFYSNITFQNNMRDNVIDTKKLTQTFEKLDTLIDRIFNNSQLANYFNIQNNFSFVEKKNSMPADKAELLHEHFSAYTATKTNKEAASLDTIVNYLDKLEKRLELPYERNEKNSNTTAFFTIIIIILLAVVCLISFGHFANHGNRFCKRPAKAGSIDERVSLNSSRIEMM